MSGTGGCAETGGDEARARRNRVSRREHEEESGPADAVVDA